MSETKEGNNNVLGEAKVVLETDVRLKVAVIGVGNAGNQVVITAHKEGLMVYALNTSIKDMSDEILGDTIPCFIIGTESRGAGKNRQKAHDLFMENGKDLFSERKFMSMTQSSDIVFVVFAGGGGTGSEIGPQLCKILTTMFPKKIIIPYTIAPKNNDSITAKDNTIQCIEDFKSCNGSYCIDDLSYYEADPNDVAFSKIGRHVVDCIKVIAGAYLKMSGSQMIDENDMRTVTKEPGYMAIYILDKVTNADLEKSSMQKQLIDKIKHSPSMMVQRDGIIKQMGVIVSCPKDMMEVTKTGDYSEIYEFLGGTVKGVFENYSTTTGTTGQFIVILSGMTFPINRVSQYIDAIKEHEENLQRVQDINLQNEIAKFAFLRSGDNSKLSSNSTASKEEINTALGEFFK